MPTIEPMLEEELLRYLAGAVAAEKAGQVGEPLIGLWEDSYHPKTKWIGFPGMAPETPDLVVSIWEEPGGAPVAEFGERRAFRVFVRGKEYGPTRAQVQRISRAFHEQQGILEPTILAARVTADSQADFLGRDGNKRYAFSQAFSIVVKSLEPQ